MSRSSWDDFEEDNPPTTRGQFTNERYWPKDRVVLGGKGLAAGIAVSHLVFSALLSIQGPEWAFAFFLYSLLPVWAIGAAMGSLLGLALRRVPNQWLHVTAFFVIALLMCGPFGGFSSMGAFLFSTSIALAAGIGRLAVWKLVLVNDQPSLR